MTLRTAICPDNVDIIIDNVLFKDKLIRWNNNDFITYYIENKDALPKTYIENIRRAFFNWQIATNSEIKFKEIDTRKKAKIQIDANTDIFEGSYTATR